MKLKKQMMQRLQAIYRHYAGMNTNSASRRISVTVPFLNEKENLLLLYGHCSKVFQSPKEKEEGLVFVDGDRTIDRWTRIKQTMENDPAVEYARFLRKVDPQHATSVHRNFYTNHAWLGHKTFWGFKQTSII